MKLKKLIATILLAVLFLAQFSWLNVGDLFVSYAANSALEEDSTTIATKYFYNQLTPDAKAFYNAMEKMLISDDFEALVDQENFGKDSKEITAEEIPGLEAKLEEYVAGKQDLLNSMGAARDAFMSDHAGVFYIDWDYFSMRVVQKEGKKHLYIGTGRSDNYVNKDFIKKDGSIDKEKLKEAYNTINSKINAIVEKANAVQVKVGQDETEQKIKVVHEEVIKSAKYTLDYKAKKAPWSVRTIYGIFGGPEEAVCAGYARGFKAVLDRLGIPCVLVTGIYKETDNRNEEHMWTYVQLDDGKWYAVDVTFDNTDEIEDGVETFSEKYLLVGLDVMTKHFPTGIISESNFEFSYPPIESVSDRFDIVYDEGDLKVELDPSSWDEHDQITTPMYKISYKGMGCVKAAENGYYIIVNQTQEYLDGTTRSSGWAYPRPDIYEFEDTEEALYLPMFHITYFQVAVTDIAYAEHKDTANKEEIIKQTTYKGTDSSILCETDIIYNPLGDYIAPPYVKSATPNVGSSQMIGTTHHISIDYDDILIEDEDPETQIGIEVCIYDRVTETYKTIDSGHYKVENFNFNGQSTVTFDFTPSEMFADDSVFYTIELTGLMGSRSHKKPVGTSYFCTHGCSLYAFKSQGFDLNVYGKPVLMDDVDVTDLNMDDMTDEEKREMADILKHRLTLVTETTTPAQEEDMLDKLDTYLDNEKDKTSLDHAREVKSTQTYNISLTLCKKQSQELLSGKWNNQTMRVMLGFPAGYGPDDAGVTFKAYHYKKDAQGNITEIEEIKCIVTELGLLLEIPSFSPFTIAAVEATPEEEKNTDKTIVIETTEGGKVTMGDSDDVADTITTLGSGKSETLKIKAEQGYEIDEITIGDKVIDVNNPEANADISFISQDAENSATEYTLKIEHDNKDLADGTTIMKVAFATKAARIAEQERGTVVAQPAVAVPSFTMTSNIYKKIETESEGPSIRAQAQKLNPGDEFSVTYSVESFSNIGTGINAIGGTISYDNTKIDYVGVEANNDEENKWTVQYNEEESGNVGKFIATWEGGEDSSLTSQPGEIFTLKFKVLEADEIKTDTIAVTGLEAGTGKLAGDAIATANDISTVVNIAPVVNSTLTLKAGSDEKHYSINDNYVTLPAGTTLKAFEDSITTSSTAKYHEIVETPVDDRTDLVSTKSQLIEDDDRTIHTGDSVTVGDKLWTFVVRGDIDGDGIVKINDLAKAKLHYIKKELLYGPYLEAAETDNSIPTFVSVGDISRIKLYLIKKITDLFAEIN